MELLLGLGMLLFVAQFLDFLSTTMAMLVLVALVHGVYVVRSGFFLRLGNHGV